MALEDSINHIHQFNFSQEVTRTDTFSQGERRLILDIYKPMVYSIIMTTKELKAWRKKNGYSQSQLARVLGVTVQSISRWERGAREIPSFLHLALKCLELEKGKEKGNHEGKHSKKG